ncbi:MAG TPA: hypothetical protein VJ914_40265 [Pseudonocardiaceae bacterium]|nr:hypothetical protein [Pseudonocardiaceae bacterium]
MTVLIDLLHARPAGIRIRLDDGDLAADELGAVDFPTGTITISRSATLREFRSTLAHELLHLRRGPAFAGYEAAEEAVVEAMAARLLVPLSQIIWPADARVVAEDLVVDEALARLAIQLAVEDAMNTQPQEVS